jgi:hypothetical protein
VRNDPARSVALLAILLLLLPLSAQAALTPVGDPFAIVEESPCSFLKDLEVIASPEGAFEVIWVDDFELEVRSRLFEPSLDPTGPPLALLPLHGGLNAFDFEGSWAGDFEVGMNVVDTGSNPSAPLAAYRVQLDEDGNPLAPPVRIKTKNFVKLAPAAGGDSLQFRAEPPFVGGPNCRSLGLSARRIDADGTPLSPESRVTRRAPAWTGSHLVVERLPNDTFVAAYAYHTCQNFRGLAARRLNANGVPLGKAINLPMPGRVGNVAGGDVVLAAQGRNFAAAAMVSHPSIGPQEGYSGFTTAVLNDKVFGPHSISSSPVSGVVDMAASPAGSYLLLFMGSSDALPRQTLFVQELDARGVPQGQPLALTDGDYIGFDGAVASLPDGRWIVVTRAQQVDDSGVCSERLVGTVVAGD